MMKKLKTLLAVLLIASLTIALVGCGSSPDAVNSSEPGSSVNESATSGEGSQPEGDSDVVALKVGASPSPHSLILEAIAPILLEQGIELEIVIFDDYVLPNLALEDGDLDANYFQHEPYLNTFNRENETDLVSAGAIHYEPMGLYAGKSDSLDNIPDGAVIGIPDDASNGGRAIHLLESLGVITLKEGTGEEATKLDIEENPHNIEIRDIEAAQLPALLPDLDFAIINGNYALSGNVLEYLLTTEDKDSIAAQYPNIIAVRNGDENNEAIVKLVEALRSAEAQAYITQQFGDTVKISE